MIRKPVKAEAYLFKKRWIRCLQVASVKWSLTRRLQHHQYDSLTTFLNWRKLVSLQQIKTEPVWNKTTRHVNTAFGKQVLLLRFWQLYNIAHYSGLKVFKVDWCTMRTRISWSTTENTCNKNLCMTVGKMFQKREFLSMEQFHFLAWLILVHLFCAV